jgi:hypothetical protein
MTLTTKVHITDDWQRDSLVLQARQTQGEDGPTVALAYAREDVDGTPVLTMQPLTLAEMNARGVTHTEGNVPGLRVRWDVAVAIAQAVIGHTKAPADPSELQAVQNLYEATEARLDQTLADLERVTLERDAARDSVVHLERLVEAKEAHLEREARTADHFHRPVETEQAKAEVETARDLHPAHHVRIQDRINAMFVDPARKP